MLWKCCTEYVSKFEILSSCHKTGKAQFSFKSQRRAIPKNVQTTIQLHVSHMLKVTIKILQARLHQYMNWEIPYVQAGFRKDRGSTDQIANIHCVIEKSREFQKNIYLCFIDYTKAFDCVDHDKMWKALWSPYHTLSILSHSVVLHSVLIVASWPADRFLRRQIRWSGTPILLRAFHRKISSSWAQKSLKIVTASIKTEDSYFLAGKLWQSKTVGWKAETSLCQQRSV